MRRSPDNVENRARFVQKEVNKRHKSETAQMAVSRIARSLFLSESTIWNDYAKNLKNE